MTVGTHEVPLPTVQGAALVRAGTLRQLRDRQGSSRLLRGGTESYQRRRGRDGLRKNYGFSVSTVISVFVTDEYETTCTEVSCCHSLHVTTTSRWTQPVLSWSTSCTCSGRESLGIRGAGIFYWMSSFLSPNQQCQRTESQPRKITRFHTSSDSWWKAITSLR